MGFRRDDPGWTDYVPVAHNFGRAPVASTVFVARWKQVGTTVDVTATIFITSNSVGSGAILLSMPTPARSNSEPGTVGFFDSSIPFFYVCVAQLVAPDQLQMIQHGAPTQGPITTQLGNGDSLQCSVRYEAP